MSELNLHPNLQDWLDMYAHAIPKESVRGQLLDSAKQINELQTRIEQLEQQLKQQWVSVDDGLPNVNENILSVDKSGRVYNSTWLDNRFKCVGLVWDHDNVTHWMPLPKPPTK
ncbi:MAG: DUF551 domain-containing protein [Proteobacteria bacterium]|nr:DUF551 domain-containing protein [Pseudomonadota bacterium]